jgi:hypothetical protein
MKHTCEVCEKKCKQLNLDYGRRKWVCNECYFINANENKNEKRNKKMVKN